MEKTKDKKYSDDALKRNFKRVAMSAYDFMKIVEMIHEKKCLAHQQGDKEIFSYLNELSLKLTFNGRVFFAKRKSQSSECFMK